MYDYVIIGGGIAGIYINSLLSKKYKTLLLEKNNHLGGRVFEMNFHGTHIKLGAGIAALHNKNLLKLLNKLKIKYRISKANVNLLFKTNFDMKKATKEIVKKFNILKKNNNKDIYSLNVKQFIKKYFGKKFFYEYDKQVEYKDYLKTYIGYYIQYYPIKDNIPEPYKLISLKWGDLVNKLCNIIKQNKQKIKLNYIEKKQYYLINNKYKTKNIIFALTINSFQKIINNSNILNINYKKYIDSIPFIKIYTYHKNGHNLENNINVADYNITDNKLSKIVIINKNILIISYCDNQNALYWYKLINNNKLIDNSKLINKLKELFKKSTQQDIEIDDIEFVYWNEGVHYYKPIHNNKLQDIINKLSHPVKNIYVCGEMLSYKQGWVEGAIESANRIYKLIS